MELAAAEDAPPGYRFKPKARELICYYLIPWVTSPGQTPFGEADGIVCAADVYSAHPGALTSRLSHFGHDDGNWYFLCVARWKDGNVGTRMNRAVQGGGTWHGSGKRIAVRGCPNGYRQTFEYRDAAGGKSAWLMEEFGSGLPEATDGEGVKVLCRVHRTPRAAADGGGDDEGERQDTSVARPKRQRFTPLQEQDFAAYYLQTAPAPPDVGCSYASTSQAAPAAAALTTWQQPPPMMEMEPGVGYHWTGIINRDGDSKYEPDPLEMIVAPDDSKDEPDPLEMMVAPDMECTGIINGDGDSKDEPDPLEMMVAPHMGWQQFLQTGYGYNYAAENAQLNEWMTPTPENALQNQWMMPSTFSCPNPTAPSTTFPCPNPTDAATQEDDDPRGDGHKTASSYISGGCSIL